jgi:glutathione S-transferase
MTARFYYSPRSCALASHIVLEYIGADFEAIRLDFQANQQRSAEYLAINAKGRVPALVTERGVITETPAILLYLAQTHPQSGVAPLDDPFALAELQAVNSWFCSTVHVVHAHGTRGARWVDDAAALQAMKAKVAQNMIDCFDWIERELLRGPWVMGKDFSVADPYLFTLTLWLNQSVRVKR